MLADLLTSLDFLHGMGPVSYTTPFIHLSVGLILMSPKHECSELGCACVGQRCVPAHSRCSKKDAEWVILLWAMSTLGPHPYWALVYTITELKPLSDQGHLRMVLTCLARGPTFPACPAQPSFLQRAALSHLALEAFPFFVGSWARFGCSFVPPPRTVRRLGHCLTQSGHWLGRDCSSY